MHQERKINIPDSDRDLEVAYFDEGRSSRTLVCLHGIQGSKESYESWLQSALSDTSRIVVPDLPGFGNSESPDSQNYDLSEQAGRLELFFDALELDRVFVFGHSLGGMLGTLLLEFHPERLLGLISSEGNLTLADCGESRHVADMSLSTFETERFRALQEKSQALRKISAEAFFKTAQSVVQISKGEHLLAVLSQAEVPVLFIRGGESHFQTEPKGLNIRNVLIPNENHFTLTESAETLKGVEGFLTEAHG